MTQENDRRNRAEQMASIIRQNLKRAITRQGVSQQEVARKAGMNPASFSQMLNGNKRLLFEDMYAVCDVLGLNIADLMDATSLQNEMQQKVEALLKQANQLTDQANNLKQQAVTLQHADALGNQAKGALVGVGSPRFLVSPFNPDAPIEGGISGAAKGALAGFVPYGVPSGSGSPSSPSKHGGIGVSGRSQAHETLRNMTTIIMHTSDHEQGGRLIARQLIDSGARHVVLVGGPRSQFAEGTTFPTIRYHLTVERLLAEVGIACDYVEAGTVADIAAHEATACAIFEQYPDVDAIVGSDVVASVALQEASRRGIEVPADLQVIAYDGTLMAETAGKRLTAIRQDFPAIAAALAVRMDSQIAADGGPASPSKNDSASDVDTQPTPEEVIPVALIPGETTR